MPTLKLDAPHAWSESQLDRARQWALEDFVRARGREGTDAYQQAFRSLLPLVRQIFDSSTDLLRLDAGILMRRPGLIDAARYLAVPPISEDDLKTLAGGGVKRGRLDRPVAMRLVRILRACMDPIRLPWLQARRRPTTRERTVAIRWTTGLWAVERIRTTRRTSSSRRQQGAVVDLLRSSGYTEEPTRRRIGNMEELPRRSFCRETILAGAKCDVAVRLFDGRLLALECKVSNSAINSVKRLNRETGEKAARWKNEFGRRVIPGAVLSGVYKLTNLLDAQNDRGVALFWEHDLEPLRKFLSRAGRA